MSMHRVLAVVACLLIGTGIGGVRNLTGDQTPERTCVETEPDERMECSDGSTCYWVNGDCASQLVEKQSQNSE